jgi:threonine dehydrogenase-like Zn-dependent dehydrogenase
MGAGEITVIEPDAAKRALSLKLGAAQAWAPGELDAQARFTGAIDVVAAQATLNEACTRVYAGGTVVCMGVPGGPREIPLPMMQRFERDLLNSGMYIPEDFDVVIEWLADGRFDTSELVTDMFPVSEAAAAFERAQQMTPSKSCCNSLMPDGPQPLTDAAPGQRPLQQKERIL